MTWHKNDKARVTIHQQQQQKKTKKTKRKLKLPQYQWPQGPRQGTEKDPKQIGQQSSAGGPSRTVILLLVNSFISVSISITT